MMLTSYTTTSVIWGNTPFPLVIANLGMDVADTFVTGVWESFNTTFKAQMDLAMTGQRALETEQGTRDMRADITDAWENEGHLWTDVIHPWLVRWAFRYMYAFVNLIVLIAGLVPVLIAYFSYLWGFFAISIATMVGPLFIPFMLLPQTDFLFWGWLRAVVGATVQIMVGGAVFVIVCTLIQTPLVIYLARLQQQIANSEYAFWSLVGHMFVTLAEFIPLFIVAWLAAGKVSEITGFILSGGSLPGSGLGQRAQGAMSTAKQLPGMARGAAGGAKLAGAAASGGAALAATKGLAAVAMLARFGRNAVLSQATKAASGR